MSNLFPEGSREFIKQRAELSPEQTESWTAFSKAVFKAGALDAKTKQLIAVSVAHVTQCPYCIRGHVKGALLAGASNEEIMEAIWVAAAGRASGAYSHAGISVHQMEINDKVIEEDHVMYPLSDSVMAAKKAKLGGDIIDKWRVFSNNVFKQNLLSEKTKQLIALAISHVTQCSYCIKGHTKMAHVKGATNDEMMEAIWVAAEMRSGAAYAHSMIAMDEMNKFAERKNK